MTDVLTRRITLRVAIGLSAIALAGTPSESQAPKDPAVETSSTQSSADAELG